MQIDSKIDPRWCEALLGMLEGDLSYNRVAEVKRMLRTGIDSIRKSRPEAPSTGSLDEESNKQISSLHKVEYSAYIIKTKELKKLKSQPFSPPIYLRNREPDVWIWTPDINLAIQFCRSIDARRYAKDGGAQFLWEIVKHSFCCFN